MNVADRHSETGTIGRSINLKINGMHLREAKNLFANIGRDCAYCNKQQRTPAERSERGMGERCFCFEARSTNKRSFSCAGGCDLASNYGGERELNSRLGPETTTSPTPRSFCALATGPSVPAAPTRSIRAPRRAQGNRR